MVAQSARDNYLLVRVDKPGRSSRMQDKVKLRVEGDSINNYLRYDGHNITALALPTKLEGKTFLLLQRINIS